MHKHLMNMQIFHQLYKFVIFQSIFKIQFIKVKLIYVNYAHFYQLFIEFPRIQIIRINLEVLYQISNLQTFRVMPASQVNQKPESHNNQPFHARASTYSKRLLYCPAHGQKLTFRCQSKHCQSPLVCSVADCLEGHFHPESNNQLILAKFQTKQISSKLFELETMLTQDDFASQAKKLKNYIDSLKSSMVSIYKDYKELHHKKELIQASMSDTSKNRLNTDQIMNNVDGTLALGFHLRNSLKCLKMKLPQAIIGQPAANDSEKGGEAIIEETNANVDLTTVTNGQKNQSRTQVLKEKISLRNGLTKAIEKQLQATSKSYSKPSSHKVNGNHRGFEDSIILDQSDQNSPVIIQTTNVYRASSTTRVSQTQVNNQTDKKQINGFKESDSNNKNQMNIIVQEKPIILQKEKGSEKQSSFQDLFKPEYKNGLKNALQNLTHNNNNKNNAVNNITSIDDISTYKQPTGIRHQNLTLLQRDFLLKRQLTLFIEKNISSDFNWEAIKEIYSSQQPLKSVQKFHQMLEGERNLLFLFIGDDTILGSFYPSRYPRLPQRVRNDKNSFLFISDKNQIVKFKAAESEFQLAVSDKLYICHGNTPSYADGIRTFQRNFDSINYCLPSFAYNKAEDQNNNLIGKNFSGIMKVRQFYIFQIQTSCPSFGADASRQF